MAEWLRRLTRKPKVKTAVGSNPTMGSLVAVRYTSPGRPEPCEGNLVAVAGSCGGVMVKHPWPLLEISLRGLATLNINTYLPIDTILCVCIFFVLFLEKPVYHCTFPFVKIHYQFSHTIVGFSMSDRTPSVLQFKFISAASHLNLLFFVCLELVFTS